MFNITPFDANGATKSVAPERSRVGALVGVLRLSEQSVTDRNLLASLANRWVEAQVMAIDPRNQAILQLQGEAGTIQAKVNLNAPAKTGDQIALRLLLADAPEAETFSAASHDVTDQATHFSPLASLLGQLTQTPTEEAPKLIQAALPGTMASDDNKIAASKANVVAKLDQTSIFHTDQLAHELENVVDKSGLFYGAHLKQWIDGERSIEQLRKEPQAAVLNGNEAPLLADIKDNQQLPKEITSLLREQLQVLEKRGFVGDVEVWQGQQARIEIADEGSGSGTAGEQWRTHLVLHLPALGEIDAELVQHQGRLNIWIKTDDRLTARQMDKARDKLNQYLQDKGLSVAGISIRSRLDNPANAVNLAATTPKLLKGTRDER